MSAKELLQQTKEFLFNRQRAYQKTFDQSGDAARAVMLDLEKFCRVKSTTFHEDPRVHALFEGRREVFLRIKDHIDLSGDKIWTKYGEGKDN